VSRVTPPVPASLPGAATALLGGTARVSGARRGGQLVAGLVLYSVSIALLVRSGLGNMPWDVLSQGISRQVGWSFGTVTLVLSVLVLAAWVPLRQRPGPGTVANVLVIGLLVDPCLALLDLLADPLPLTGALALVVAGIGLNGLATALYIGARLGPGPRDGLMTGLVGRTGWSVRVVRSGIEATVVLAGWALGGTLGWATLGYALAIGPLAHALLPRYALPAPSSRGPWGGRPAREPGSAGPAVVAADPVAAAQAGRRAGAS